VDGRTDLFAFGVILYSLLTGHDPWLGNPAYQPTTQIYELMVATDRAEVRPMGESGRAIPPGMVNVVMKLLRRDPAERFQSARELRDTLLRLSADAVAGGTVASAAGVAAPAPVAPAHPVPAPPEGATVPRPPTPSERRDAERAETRPAPRPRPVPKKRGGAGKWAALALLVLGGGATAWAQPWGRTLDVDTLLAHVRSGSIGSVWFNETGVEGGLQLLPVPAAAGALVPFSVPVPEEERPELAETLREAGATVDVSWEVRRLLDEAAAAQDRSRYYGAEGADVRSYARRLQIVDPDSPEAAALLRKVGERMAWDAEAALDDGSDARASELVAECLAMMPDHPRCVEVSGALP
jgi:hypothetical protein